MAQKQRRKFVLHLDERPSVPPVDIQCAAWRSALDEHGECRLKKTALAGRRAQLNELGTSVTGELRIWM